MRTIVVGGGILGLATARLIAREEPGADVVLVEKEGQVAQHQTGRNSGVAHAGLYYAPGSLKARLCRRGLGLLRSYCAERELAWNPCGKLVVAVEDHELEPLRRLHERAEANGVPGLRWLSDTELLEVEPHGVGLAALHSPETAIVDFTAVARAFADDIKASGGQIRLNTTVRRVMRDTSGAQVEIEGGDGIRGDRVIVCAGLWADRIARASGERAEPRIVPFRGEYWQLRDDRSHLVNGLIYPVPDPKLPFLGVHLTKRIDGSVWVGPNAVLALSREGYKRRTVNPSDLFDMLTWPGTARMMRRHWRVGISEMRRSARRGVFIADAKRYLPELTSADVVRAPAGVRAQALDRDGSLVDDFRLSASAGVIWVRNAPSPAATSSLAIAEELVSYASAAAR